MIGTKHLMHSLMNDIEISDEDVKDYVGDLKAWNAAA